MNEEAREAAWQGVPERTRKATPMALRNAFRELFDAGWDAARTFTAEDVERATAAIEKRQWGEYPFSSAFSSELARAALGAIGTVEEARA